MSYDVSCTSASTATQLVCRYCIPDSRGAIPHVVRRIDEYVTPFLCHETFTAACEEGASIRTLDFLLERVAPVWEKAVNAAARGGHMHVFRWMTQRQDGRGPWNRDFHGVLTIAAANGHLELVQWLYPRGMDCRAIRAIDESAPGYVEKSWLYEHCTAYALEAAAEHGHLEVVQWIHGIGTDTSLKEATPMYGAVANGHLAVAQWLYTNTSLERCSDYSIATAAKNGHLESLQWLESKSLFKCSNMAMEGAAASGNFEVFKWLGERNKGCTQRVLWTAVSTGHLEAARWICDRYRVGAQNISRHHVWLAAQHGHLESVQWLDAHFPALFSCRYMEYAAEEGQFDTVKWLHEHRREGCTARAPIVAAGQGHLDILQFLHTHYSNKFTASVMDWAAASGQLDVVRWLHENRSEGCTTEAMDDAAIQGHLEVVQWLLEHRTEGFSGPAMATPQSLDVLCLFDNAQSDSEFSHIAQLSRLRVVYEQRPAFFRGCLRCLAETAVIQGNIRILDWVNQFGIELLSTTPLRDTVVRGEWRVLEWFHKNGFAVLEPDLLELALEEKELDAARWLFTHGYEINSLRLVEIAGKNEQHVPLMRWLVEHGPPLSLSVATTLALEYWYVEITWWLAEADRVQLVLKALREGERDLLWWLLTRTPFKNECGRDLIRDALQCASRDIELWLQEDLGNCEECRWCFGTTSNGGQNDTAASSA